MRRFAIFLLLLLLAACGTNLEPTQSDLKEVWDARNVPPANYKGDIVAYMCAYLNDPTDVRNAAVSAPALKRLRDDPGDRFVSCVRYGAKRMTTGQYGATRTGVAVFVSGKLDRFIDTPIVVRDACKDAQLDPFPELQHLKR